MSRPKQPAEPLPEVIVGVCRERERTLAILDNFIKASIPQHDRTLLERVRERVTSRGVTDVIQDKTPVIQLPTTAPGPKRKGAA